MEESIMIGKKLSRSIMFFLSLIIIVTIMFSNIAVNPKVHASNVILNVNAGTVVAPMKQEMRGTNIGLWTSSSFHPVANRSLRYVNLMKEAGISMIRFPAGSESDMVYWDRTNTGVWYQGPGAYERTLTASTFDSFISLASEVDAEPLITVNARINNKLMAADMVRYANIEKGYNIKYWEIGNEPEFYGGAYATTPQNVATRIQEYSDAMKAVDPSIIIVGPANAQPALLTDWTKPILSQLKNNNKPVGAISIHWYPLWGEQTNTGSSSYPTITNLLKYEGSDYQNSYINWANKFTDTTPTDNLVNYRNQYAPGALIGITEIGQVTGGNEGEGIGDTLAGALWMGDVLGRLAYHKVDFVTQFLLEGEQAYALMDTNKAVRPAFYLYPLLKRYFGDTMVLSESSDNQNFTIWASKRSGVGDKLHLMVINKNQTQNMSATINLSNFNPQSTALSWELNGPSVQSTTGISINGTQVASNGTLPSIAGTAMTGIAGSFTKTFPAHSITMIELTAAGGSSPDPENGIDDYTFCANEFGSCSFSGTASVAFGANNSYLYGTFTNGTVCTVAAFGGDPAFNTPKKCYYKLSGSTPAVQLLNAGFEAPTTANFSYGPITNGWAFNNRAGVQKNGSAFGATTAPEGVQTAFIQSVNGVHGEISQSVSLAAGTYRISVQAAKRTNYGGAQTVDVWVGQTLVGSITPSSGSFDSYTTSTFTVASGNHNVRFVGTAASGDHTAFIDSVNVTTIN
jgi:hypothetical protein